MSKRQLIKDYKITGGYIYTRPTKDWSDGIEDYIDDNDQEWRYKSELLQKRRWRKIMNSSGNNQKGN